MTIHSHETIATIMQHRSCRQYTDQPVDEATLEAIINAARMASSSSFMQCVHIVRITDKQLREALCAVASNQRYVVEAPEFLVFCMDFSKHARLVDNAQLDWAEITLTGAVDAGIAAQNALLAAQSLGLGGVYIGSLRNDVAQVAKLLGLGTHSAPLFGLCIGYPAQKTAQRPRMGAHMSVSINRYQAPSAEDLALYDAQVAQYYRGRGLEMTWSQALHKTLSQPVRPHILPFLHGQGFARR